MLRLILSLNLFFSISALALTQKECVEAGDLSDKFGPVRNQGSVSQCYAFTSADLMSYRLGIKGDSAISAIDVSLSMLTSRPKDLIQDAHIASSWNLSQRLLSGVEEVNSIREKSHFFNWPQHGGNIASAVLAYNRQNGYCTESDFSSEKSSVFLDRNQFFQNEIMKIYVPEVNFKATQDQAEFVAKMGLKPGEPFDLVRGRLLSRSSFLGMRRENCRPEDALRSKNNVFFESNQIAMQSAKNYADSKCLNRKSFDKFDVDSIFVGHLSDKSKVIAHFLKSKIPIGIGYAADFLTKGKETKETSELHASLIIGARWDKKSKKCEFKIRNSWGPSCQLYHNDYKSKCELGNIWVASDEIEKNVFELSGIEGSP